MKKILGLMLLLLTFNLQYSYSQGYVQPQEYVPFVKPYVPNTAIDDYSRNLDRLNNLYDRNMEKLTQMCKWVTDLKRQSSNTDDEFKNEVSYYSDVLYRLVKRGDYEYQTREINEVSTGLNKAIDNYNERLKEKPSQLWKSGNTNLENEKYEDAILNYNELIEYAPDFSSVYRNRGYAYYQLEKNNLALNDFNKYINTTKDDAFAYEKRAWVKNALGDFEGAKLDFDMAIELKSQNAYLYYGRGLTKSNLNDNQGAISDYTKAIKIDPSFSMAYNNRGWCKFEMKLLKDALKDVQQAIILDSTNSVALDSRQEIKFALNDFAGCIKDCNKTLVLNPDCANAYYFRGRANFKLNNKKTICADWQKAVDLGKKEAYNLLLKYCADK
jgi:tetratricopeptide (TPR) repeat protein